MTSPPFREGHVEADGSRIRYVEAGSGPPLVHLPGPGALHPGRAHDLLAARSRVVAFEMPEGPRTRMPELALTMTRAIDALGLDTFDLLGTSSGATTALGLALRSPRRVRALVLEGPDAVRPSGRDPELEGRLRELSTPTLVLFGTRDAVIPPAVGHVYKDLIPGSHLVYVYDAGHVISADRPEAFTEVVVDFLEHHESFVIRRTPMAMDR